MDNYEIKELYGTPLFSALSTDSRSWAVLEQLRWMNNTHGVIDLLATFGN